MTIDSPRKFDRTNAIVAVGVWLTVLIVYWLTKAPSMSFWDCGEFIAASYTLGVPHPPGTPLYIIIGRFFSLLPLSDDIGVRINLLSAVSSSVAAMFGYLVAVRILRACFDAAASRLNRISIYAGAASGAFFFAFGLTNWNNSVETEVYGLSMMMLMAIVWLALVYRDNMGTAFGERAMMLIYFIAFAGIGVHLTTYLALPAMALMFILRKGTPTKVWFIIGGWVLFELYLIFALSSRPDEIPYYVPIIIVLVFYLFYIFSYEKIPALYLVVAGGFLLSIIPIVTLLSGVESTAASALKLIGKIGFVGLIGVAVYFLYRGTRKDAGLVARRHYTTAALFILIATVMVLVLLLDMRGYKAFLVATAVLGLAVLVGFYRHINWPVMIATASVSMVILGVWQMVFGLLAALVIIPVLGLAFKLPEWKNAMLILLVAALGYSTHVFIPIRSARQPTINENNPSESLDALVNYIERKQYGSQSMVERMFQRRAEWANQFGDYRRMGFWHFFKDQYGLSGVRFAPLLVIGLYGLWEVLRKRTQYGVPLMILIFIASVGLILYMNFADGTRQHPVTGADYIEVRDRDYFFTPAFILFGLAIGIGLTAIVQFVKDGLQRSTPGVRKLVTYASLALFLLPALTLARNYHYADRSDNYMAYDYAWNLLTSAEKNAVLITAGDNDTFPLWCIQETYGVRKDVAVVNLSLANARWYIKQLKSTLGIDLGWSDDDIDSMVVFRDQFGNVHRLQDQVVTEIIRENFGRRPINFSFTVPSSGRKFLGQPLDSLMVMQGLVWRLERSKGKMTVDVDKSYELFMRDDGLRFRGIADDAVYKNETALRLTSNYVNPFILTADSLVAMKDFKRAEDIMEKIAANVPYAADAVHYLGALYAEQGKRDKLKNLTQTSEYGDKRWLMTVEGRMELKLGNVEKAESVFQSVLARYPTYRQPLEDLIRLYYESRQLEKMQMLLVSWMANNPDDQEIRSLLNGVKQQIEKIDSTGESDQ